MLGILNLLIVNCSSEMVLSIRYSTIKKKEAAHIEYPTIRVTSFVSIVVFIPLGNNIQFSTNTEKEQVITKKTCNNEQIEFLYV
jgi:hypothetical protein